MASSCPFTSILIAKMANINVGKQSSANQGSPTMKEPMAINIVRKYLRRMTSKVAANNFMLLCYLGLLS